MVIVARLGKEFGVSDVTAAKVWNKWDIQPRCVQTFKFSSDPELEAKERAYDPTSQAESPRRRLSIVRLECSARRSAPTGTHSSHIDGRITHTTGVGS
jgi:hypothetical protein